MEEIKCCEKCESNMGGGASMLPFVRGCRNLDCECHSLAHTTEKMIPDPSFRNLVGESQGDWKKEFEQRYLRDGSWILDGKNGAEIISFIRQLLSKREEEAYERGYNEDKSSRAADLSCLLDEDEQEAIRKIRRERDEELQRVIEAIDGYKAMHKGNAQNRAYMNSIQADLRSLLTSKSKGGVE